MVIGLFNRPVEILLQKRNPGAEDHYLSKACYFLIESRHGRMVSMSEEASVSQVLERIEGRLERIENMIEGVRASNRKSLEWVAMLSEHIQSLDEFREEVRESFEPLNDKLTCSDEVVRILRHATVDVSRRIERLERLESRNRLNS